MLVQFPVRSPKSDPSIPVLAIWIYCITLLLVVNPYIQARVGSLPLPIGPPDAVAKSPPKSTVFPNVAIV